jgi:anti-anti-sigma factor
MKIATKKKDYATIVFVKGKMDATASSAFEKEMHEFISQGIKYFILDLSELDYISSAGLRTVLTIGKKINDEGGELSLVSVKEHVKEVFEIAGFTYILPLYESTASALKKIQICIWGARGSIPATVTSDQIRERIFGAFNKAKGLNLDNDQAIIQFVDSLPFSIRATYGCNTPCVEIRGSHEYIICDAGSGIRDLGNLVMQQQEERKNHVFHIFISHLHWDHIQGFPFFTPAYIRGNQVKIYGCHSRLREAFIRQQESMSFPVPFDYFSGDIEFTILETDKEYEIGGFNVKAIKQNHPGDSYGYRFSRRNKKVIYSTDSEHKKEANGDKYEYLDFIQGADLMIFDAQYSLVEAVHTKEDWGHSSNLLGVELAVKAGVKHLCLFHSEHTFDDKKLEQILNDTRRYLQIHASGSPLQIDLAYEGLKIDI